jgi:DNA-binding LytR/AlgR family response regulator
VNNPHPQSALREWRTLMIKPATAVVLVAIAALLAILGPFGTGDRLSLGPRFGYWLVMAACTFSAGFLVNEWLNPHLPSALPMRIAAQAAATAVAITPVITALNLVSFGYWPSLAEWPALLAQFAAIALITTVIFQALSGQMQPTADTAQDPALLSRLPLEKRGALMSLSSEDHYTRVRTNKGEELILIRLADAIAEAAPTAGLRVHRSHWVATAQVTSATRKGDGAVLTIANGSDIPVSRSHMTAVRDAGLLPR